MSYAIALPAPAAKKRPPRLRLLILLLGLAAALVFDQRFFFGTPMDRYAHDFDHSVGNLEPEFPRIFAADPVLRQKMLLSTHDAYDRGGWPAASARFFQMKDELLTNAGDEKLLACKTSLRDAARSLLGQPALCPKLLRGDGTSEPALVAAYAPFRAPCDAALEEAAQRRAAGDKPIFLSAAELRTVFAASFDRPAALSMGERRALLGIGGDPGATCRAAIKVTENQLALPAAQAAALLRSELATGGKPPVQIEDIVAFEPPPRDLVYPPSGTVFTLSMEGGDGRPITWTSLGQKGWDCRLHSSASGDRGLWGEDFANPLYRLWPLAVGKSAEISGLGDHDVSETDAYRVTGYASYWLPIGWRTAYAIEDRVTIGGELRYIMTFYWSPDLGFKIGQHTQVISGGWPSGIAPDWQVIGMSSTSGK